MGGRPGGGSARPSGPATAGQKRSAAVESKEQWTEWWHFNQYRFVRAAGRSSTITGGSETGTEGKGPMAELQAFLQKEALKDRHFDPQSAAALALGKVRFADARADLEALVKDAKAHNYVRESAALGLGMMQSLTSTPVLLGVASDRSSETRLRVHAIISLGLMKESSVVPQLQAVLQRQDDREVHMAAAMALGLIGDKGAAMQLVGIVKSGGAEGEVRAAAATALGKLGLDKVGNTDIFEMLKKCALADREDHVRRAVALVMYKFDHKDVLSTLERVARNDRDAVTRGFALISMAEAVCRDSADAGERKQVRTVLESILGGGDDKEKGFAAIAMGLLGRSDRECATQLRKGFQTEKTWLTQAACAVGLGIMKDVASKQEIADLVQKQVNADLRGYCCMSLGMMGDNDPQIAKYLVEIVDKVSVPELKAAAAMALAKIGPNPEAIEVLRKALRDRNQYFKMSAILALGYFRDPATIKDLIAHYKGESNAEARAITVVALGYVGEVGMPALKTISMDFNYLAVFLNMEAIDQIIRLF